MSHTTKALREVQGEIKNGSEYLVGEAEGIVRDSKFHLRLMSKECPLNFSSR
jgi:hypothetical protein